MAIRQLPYIGIITSEPHLIISELPYIEFIQAEFTQGPFNNTDSSGAFLGKVTFFIFYPPFKIFINPFYFIY